MKQRIACIVLVDLRDGIGRPSVDETADLLLRTGIISTSRQDANKLVNSMIDKGHRYKNLQQGTSAGVALVLGISLPEYWWVVLKVTRHHS